MDSSSRMVYVRRMHTFSLTIFLVVATCLLCVTVQGQKSKVKGIEDATLTYDNPVKNIFPSLPHLTSTESNQNLDEYNKNIKNVFGIFTSSTTSTSTYTNEETEIIDEEKQEPLQQIECLTNSDTCTPYYTCDNNTVDTTDSEPAFIDIRLHIHESCPSIHVCCSESKKNNVSYPLSDADIRTKCGQRNSDGVGPRISTFGSEAQFSEFPWMVAILDTSLNYTYFCGASLIHPSVVLTATHCLNERNLNNLVLRAGEWDSQSRSEIYPHEDRYISKVIKHDKFVARTVENNIALIFLNKPFTLRENIGTICLPPQDYSFDGDKCFASGWGKDIFGKKGRYQNILKKVDVPIVPRNECLRKLRRTRLGNKFVLPNMFLCAGGEMGKDTCKGDGGSPLVCPTLDNEEQYHQAGIVSWGIGCGSETPGVYTDVSKFRNWIDELFQTEGLDSSYYEASYKMSQIN